MRNHGVKRGLLWVALVMMITTMLLTGCENVLGEDDETNQEDEQGQDDDPDNNDDTGDVADTDEEDLNDNVEPTSWIYVSEQSLEHPFDGSYRVAIIDIRDSQMKIIFYEEVGADGVLQVAGGLLPYETNSEEITFEWSHAWLGDDPGEPEIDYSGKDWYEIPSSLEAPSGGTMQMDGDTLTVNGGGGALEFSKVDFGLPADLVKSWDLAVDGYTGELILGSTSDAPEAGWASLSYTWNEPDSAEQTGSGYWQATDTGEGFFRQVYTEISDEEDLEYWEHLTPYALQDGTLTFYTDLNRTEAGAYSYQRRQ